MGRILIAVALLLAATTPAQEARLRLVPAREGARTGSVSVRVTTEGLTITGSVAGGPPNFATRPEDMAKSDHVELWIAPVTAPALPPLGWGSQFGIVTGKTAKDCPDLAKQYRSDPEKCIQWFQSMPGYRARFRRLFVRQYQLAPGVAVESFAEPAFAEIVSKFDQRQASRLEPLRPKVMPTLRSRETDAGYSFEIRAPWAALPPVNDLKLNSLGIAVDVFSTHSGAPATQPFSTTSPKRKWGEPSSFGVVVLRPERRYMLTRCEYPLEAEDLHSTRHPAWFIPTASAGVRKVFVIQNASGGY